MPTTDAKESSLFQLAALSGVAALGAFFVKKVLDKEARLVKLEAALAANAKAHMELVKRQCQTLESLASSNAGLETKWQNFKLNLASSNAGLVTKWKNFKLDWESNLSHQKEWVEKTVEETFRSAVTRAKDKKQRASIMSPMMLSQTGSSQTGSSSEDSNDSILTPEKDAAGPMSKTNITAPKTPMGQGKSEGSMSKPNVTAPKTPMGQGKSEGPMSKPNVTAPKTPMGEEVVLKAEAKVEKTPLKRQRSFLQKVFLLP